ncbi:MAG: hypothetical protein GY822_02200 [Deltaproteobacteria bacterium]|nr:hypothetical protein [Deltaproteobacteria bacterium]
MPSLLQTGAELDVGTAETNLSVYAPPIWVSPVRFSRYGQMLAYLGPQGNAVLADAATLETLHEIDLSFVDFDLVDEWRAQDAESVVNFAFSQKDDGLFVQQRAAISHFACANFTPPSADHALAVLLEVPLQAVVGDEVTFQATHLGAPDVHAHAFFVDGAPIFGGGLERSVSFTPTEAGAYLIEVEVDNGLEVGRASQTLTVRAD